MRKGAKETALIYSPGQGLRLELPKARYVFLGFGGTLLFGSCTGPTRASQSSPGKSSPQAWPGCLPLPLSSCSQNIAATAGSCSIASRGTWPAI